MDEWRLDIPECPPQDVAALRRELAVSDALAQTLVRRGLGEPARARAFLDASEQHDPGRFEGIGAAVASIARHIDERRRITVHGDYDVDGVCSTAVMVTALRRLGADVDWYLPDRAGDGYGLNGATIERLAGRGTSLLVSVDCGVAAVEEVERALALGLEVVISDHHSPRPDGVLPRAPIVHPGVCNYPCRELCATAVAYKLAQALYSERGRDPVELEAELDLVALATIADVVPLLGENRTLAVRGLRRLESTTRPGLRALMEVARVTPGRAGERAVAFGLAPRLNAAGRLYRADAALELLLTEDPGRARQVAHELDSANRERQQVERAIRHQAEAQLAELGEREAYVLSGEGWHPGVIGIVASRMVERSGRPVVMVALDGEHGRGSGRSIDAFDLLGGLQACSGHLRRFGGHRVAAGVELARDQLEAFSNALCDHAREVLSAEELCPVEHIDAVVRVAEVDMGLAEELESLAPFGRSNPRVRLLLEGASFADSRPMGEGRHVRFSVSSGGRSARAVAFGCDGRLPVADGEPVQATFSLEINEWNGVCEPRLVLRRARAAEQPAADTAPRRSGRREAQQELALFAV